MNADNSRSELDDPQAGAMPAGQLQELMQTVARAVVQQPQNPSSSQLSSYQYFHNEGARDRAAPQWVESNVIGNRSDRTEERSLRSNQYGLNSQMPFAGDELAPSLPNAHLMEQIARSPAAIRAIETPSMSLSTVLRSSSVNEDSQQLSRPEAEVSESSETYEIASVDEEPIPEPQLVEMVEAEQAEGMTSVSGEVMNRTERDAVAVGSVVSSDWIEVTFDEAMEHYRERAEAVDFEVINEGGWEQMPVVLEAGAEPETIASAKCSSIAISENQSEIEEMTMTDLSVEISATEATAIDAEIPSSAERYLVDFDWVEDRAADDVTTSEDPLQPSSVRDNEEEICGDTVSESTSTDNNPEWMEYQPSLLTEEELAVIYDDSLGAESAPKRSVEQGVESNVNGVGAMVLENSEQNMGAVDSPSGGYELCKEGVSEPISGEGDTISSDSMAVASLPLDSEPIENLMVEKEAAIEQVDEVVTAFGVNAEEIGSDVASQAMPLPASSQTPIPIPQFDPQHFVPPPARLQESRKREIQAEMHGLRGQIDLLELREEKLHLQMQNYVSEIDQLNEQTVLLEKLVQEMPDIYREKFRARMKPIQERIAKIQEENLRLHDDVDWLTQKLAENALPPAPESRHLIKLPSFGRRLPLLPNAVGQ
ncbi:MAG: hypothetical protein AB4040_10640 [Synechococcus sp.]